MALLVARGFGTLRDRYGVNEVKMKQLRTIVKLGEGAFATVEKCEYIPPTGPPRIVAVKKLKANIMQNEVDVTSFINEVTLLRKLQHPYIMKYIGIGSVDATDAKKKRETMFLVTEIMEGGTLKKLVMAQMMNPHKQMYSLSDGLRWMINIASALAYLHNSTPTVIHRDLKLENILLRGLTRSTQEACLADFGLAAFIRQHVSKPKSASKKETVATAQHKTTADYDQDVAFMQDKIFSKPPPSGILGKLEASVKGGMDFIERSVRGGNTYGQSMRGGFGASGRNANHSVRSGNLYQIGNPSLKGGNLYMTNGSTRGANNLGGFFDKSNYGSRHYKPDNLPVPKALLSGKTGSLMYMSPEMYRNEHTYSEKVDVFSFGVMLYEVIHKYMMFFAISMEGTEEELEVYAKRVSEGYRPPIHADYPNELKSLIEDCWNQEPSKRPSMTDVEKRLQYIQDQGLLLHINEGGGDGCCVIS